jgi:hypothetical protein
MSTESSKQKKRIWRRGVFVVEASVIVPMAIMMIALLIIMIFYVHNRCWYRCAAYECAIVGNGAEILSESDGEHRASALAEERIRDQVMPGTAPKSGIRSSKSGTSVSFSGQTYPMFHRELRPFRAEAEVVRVNPENFLRVRWAAEAAKDALNG